MSSTRPRRRSGDLEAENEALRAALEEAQQTLEAIQAGQVDALVIDGPAGQRIFSLAGADRPYRALIEQMQEGALILGSDGSIQYCNRAFAAFLRRPLETIAGGLIIQHLMPVELPAFISMLNRARVSSTHGEIAFRTVDGGEICTYVSLTPLADEGEESISMVVTDLTERKHAERLSSSAHFVQSLIEKAPIGVAVLDTQRRYLLANPVYRALARDMLVAGRKMDEVFVPAVVQMVETLVAQVLETGEPVHVPECLIPDGRPSWWNMSLVPLREPSTATTSVLILTEDITEEKAAALRAAEDLERNLSERRRWQAQLQANEDRLRIGLSAARAGVFDMDLATGDAVWSAEHYPLLGLEPNAESPSYALWRRHLHPDDAERVEAELAQATTSGQRYTAEYRVIGGDGTERWVQSQGLIIERTGEPRRMIGALVDITERKETEARLRRSQEALQEADRRKDDFLATLAHELRNPLAPIRNIAQILGSHDLAPHQLQWAQSVIQRQVGQMGMLLDDLLDVARITRGKLDLNRERVTLNDVVDSAVEAARPLLDSRKHTLVVSLPRDVATLDADPLRLSQVFSNLLTNAAKYTNPMGRIELSAYAEAGILCVEVKDNGIGIAPESLGRIFEMFSQIKTAQPRAEPGLGIGLALVQGILELHGGAIEAASEGLGRGSTFTVRLPLAADQTLNRAAASTEAPPATSARRILVADDNEDAANSVAMLLQLSGHDVRVVHGGRAALSMAETFRPDIALLDIGMPELNGYELAKALRREPWGAGISLIAVTGWGQERDRKRAMDAGFDKHLTKPIDPSTLEAVLSNLRDVV